MNHIMEETEVLPLELLDKRQDAALRKKGYKTFAGWKLVDRTVIFGQKARCFDSKGRALFHLEQTTVPETFPGRDGDEGWDDEYDLFDGDPWSLF